MAHAFKKGDHVRWNSDAGHVVGIEDEPGLTPDQKHQYQSAFLDVVMGKADAACLSDELGRHLTERTLAAERDLIRNLPQVLSVTATLNATQGIATLACLTVMTQGTSEFDDFLRGP